jgi:hypothetical protein
VSATPSGGKPRQPPTIKLQPDHGRAKKLSPSGPKTKQPSKLVYLARALEGPSPLVLVGGYSPTSKFMVYNEVMMDPTGRPKLSETDAAIRWIRQFKLDDQRLATALLDEMRLVTHAELIDGLRTLVAIRSESIDGPVGLYAEREVVWNQRLFKESNKVPRRATGQGPKLINPLRMNSRHVGSEGIVASLITELSRENPDKYYSHPGPDAIRKANIRSFTILTDFIGSGNQMSHYLDSAWRVRSVKSWHSFGWLRFDVIAYSCMGAGRRRVETHPSRPNVSMVTPCPNVAESFGCKTQEVMRLCRYYDPNRSGDPADSMGYDGAGALIAFAHGCPNNVPRLLHKSKKDAWRALFPARVTAGTREVFGDRRDASTLAMRLQRLGENRLGTGDWIRRAGASGRNLIAVLAAVRKGPRLDDVVASRTGLTVPEVRLYVGQAEAFGWVDSRRRATDAGLAVLASMRAYQAPKKLPLPPDPDEPYYPGSLRAP